MVKLNKIMKGQHMQSNNKNNRVKITLLLDDETLKALRAYAYYKIGKTSVSKAVMLMVKEYGIGSKEKQSN